MYTEPQVTGEGAAAHRGRGQEVTTGLRNRAHGLPVQATGNHVAFGDFL